MKTSKKIAVAIAAVLAFTGISTSAHAAPLSVTVAGSANATTSAAPQTVAVPVSNVIDTSNTVALAATADTGTVVSFVGSGVKLVSALNTTLAPVSSASGVSSISVTSTGVAATIYAYTTSTTTGSVTITNGAYSTIVYIKGLAGVAANIAVSVPSTAAIQTAPTFSVSATDVFGNPVASEAISVTLIGGSFSDASITKTLTTSAVTSAAGVTPVTILGSATGTFSALTAGTVTVVATDTAIATTSLGLPAAIKSAIATFSVSDFNAQIVSLTAQLAAEKAGRVVDKATSDKALADAKTASDKALADAKTASDATAAIAAATYKAGYNALATKWNKAHPKSKVALKK